MKVTIKKLDPEATAPSYAYKGDAGMDIFSNEDYTLKPRERHSFCTGIAMHLPESYVALVWDKSGLSHKAGLKTLGGVMDAGYQGEYKIGLINLGEEDIIIKKGDKIAQILIQPVESVSLEETDEIETSDRGDKGFGSSGK